LRASDSRARCSIPFVQPSQIPAIKSRGLRITSRMAPKRVEIANARFACQESPAISLKGLLRDGRVFDEAAFMAGLQRA